MRFWEIPPNRQKLNTGNKSSVAVLQGIAAFFLSTENKVIVFIARYSKNILHTFTHYTNKKDYLTTLHSGRPPPFQSDTATKKFRLRGKLK